MYKHLIEGIFTCIILVTVGFLKFVSSGVPGHTCSSPEKWKWWQKCAELESQISIWSFILWQGSLC